MKRIEQRTSADCLRCCIAMVTGVPYEDVPDFVQRDGTNWSLGVAKWAPGAGFACIRLRATGDGEIMALAASGDIPWIATGESPRGRNHAVVCVGEMVLHDPHPSRAGIDDMSGALFLLPATLEPHSRGSDG